MNIILCGLQKSGKTTLGQSAAATLGWEFIDIDRLIERAYWLQSQKKSSCRQIFFEEGERAFRTLEKKQIASLSLAANRCIIALGGGSLADGGNVAHLKKLGLFIYLNTPLDMLWHRIEEGATPAYLAQHNSKESFYKLAQERTPLFEEYADYTIETALLGPAECLKIIMSFAAPR